MIVFNKKNLKLGLHFLPNLCKKKQNRYPGPIVLKNKNSRQFS